MFKLLNEKERLALRNSKEFKNTNYLWNKLELNSRNSVGCLMHLIKQSHATTKEEWEKYYFKTGEERKKIHINNLNQLSIINAEYGRTIDDLEEISIIFNKELHLDLNLVFNFVYIRVIDETWIGYEREKKAFEILSDKTDLTIKTVSYQDDIRYAVDFEVYKNGKLILAIQLKSSNYKHTRKYVHEMNIRKNKEYSLKNHVAVIYLYIDNNKIVNLDDFLNNI